MKFAGLIASSAACTKESDDTSTTNIATLSGNVDTAQAEVDRLQGEIDTATKEPVVDAEGAETEAGGAWYVANVARNDAVANALAGESEADIAAKLNEVDSTANAERIAAQNYVDADKNLFLAGLVQAKAQAAWDLADQKKTDITTGKTNAETAVNEAWDQLTKE